MARQYYYFAASLPLLEFDKDPPLTSEEYLNDCQRLLTQEDFEVLRSILADEEDIYSEREVARKIAQFNRDFRNEVAWFRAERAKQDPADHLRGSRSGNLRLVELVNQAAKASHLLEGEKILARAQWREWGNFEVGRFFSLEYFIIYGLKLQLLECCQEINATKKGEEIFKEYQNVEIPGLTPVE